MLRCPNCQTINPSQAKFCLECGNRLVVCPNCGTVNLPIAKFCIECGTALALRGENTAPLSLDAREPIGLTPEAEARRAGTRSPTPRNTLGAINRASTSP